MVYVHNDDEMKDKDEKDVRHNDDEIEDKDGESTFT
jgi:hypothetical protein